MKKLFTVYDRYIFNQVLITTIVAILLFTIVWIAPEMLLNTIKKILAHEYTVKTGVMVLIYELPKILGKAFPVGLLLGSLFTFDKLSKDSELTIFRAVGMSFWRILAPLLVLSLIVTYLCFVTYDKWIPYSCQKLQEIKGGSSLTQYIYTKKDQNNHPEQAVIVSRFYQGEMTNVIVLNFSKQVFDDLHGLTNILTAETGYKGVDAEGKPSWVLKNVTDYDINEDGIFKSITKKDRVDILNGEDANDAYTIMLNSTKRDRDINNQDLKHYVNLLKKANLDEDYRLMYNKYLQRFFHPFVCVLLAIMGCLLGFSKPREQRLIGFTIAIGCIFVYYITLPFFDLLAEKGVLPPLITAAFPPLAFLCAIIAFYKSRDL
ncbi:TPA: YjgP/YjgQ family permease [Candidatus Gastranaerophilales bacterium HUM_3]|jgi:lipopolysaccharide export system permease protein|nr:LptF/LptG family permease [bacterium]MBS5805491.1 LptF/LptG family permease [Acinetobacter sp.]CCZ50055.1 permease YjgP/YjgQ family [Acinetobacter sp. CAG:196]DAA87066.1 MAG TPA: YjgP/YjgQ family permease [Candidatus Gastranaerophilales bacterium HUM_3]DAA88803.1 MAG TPA: YjgP/YjgQ family permease [Candidatus Gastranaerophilales bacterium HUM_4]DAA89397.1 MAG TPA: YjgP/YjgQ family permease [Candidatus Gastranaerophilales bacterium HUM_5]DAA96986.1 MAG TPA: YjgP/YjgQ family permease [Candid